MVRSSFLWLLFLCSFMAMMGQGVQPLHAATGPKAGASVGLR